MKIAILHEMLIKLWWAEKVVESFLEAFPEADLFTLIYDENKVSQNFPKNMINPQCFNLATQKRYNLFKKQRFCLPLMAKSVESLDFSEYDVVLCSSSWFAHGAITKPETKFIVYYHSPARYLWDYTNEYKNSLWINNGFKKVFRYFLNKMLLKNRIWDYMASNRVDIPLAASNHVSKRIEKYYRRNDFKVIYPSVEIDKFLNFKTEIKKEDYYITIAALTQWKRLDVLIKAFNKMPEKKLKIVWVWDYELSYRNMVTSSNIEFVWYKSWNTLITLLKQAKWFLFASMDDFWIAPVEALACNTPVFWLWKWWLLETNLKWITWDFFYLENWEDFIENFKLFEKNIDSWTYKENNLQKHVKQFSKQTFIKQIKEIVK